MLRTKLGLLAALSLSATVVCWGQDVAAPPAVSVPVAPAYDDKTPLTSASVLASDNRPPSGAQPVGLGVSNKKEMDISLNANQSWQSNAFAQNLPNSWDSMTSFGGALQLNFNRANSQTLLNYAGNVINYSYLTPAWTTSQNVSFSQNIRIGRWTLTGLDKFNYSPNPAFGWYGYGSTSAVASTSSGGSASIVNPQYVPNQSILTPPTASYSNTVVGQLEYGLTRRSSWTGSVSYGILRYPDSDFLNSNQVIVSTGYNYSPTARDTVSVTYSYSDFRYTGINSSFSSQNVQLGYAHRLTGRLALQISGGPEFANTTAVGGTGTKVRFSGNGNLTYARTHTNLTLSYFAGTTAGSGVLVGAQTETAQFAVNRSIARAWLTGCSVGYSRNSGFGNSGFDQQHYDALYVTPTLRRTIARNLGVSFSYSYQRQLTNSNCVGSVCGTVSWSVVSAGIDYHLRPIRLE